MLEKICNGCRRLKPIGEFCKRSSRPCGRVSRCKDCRTQTHKKWVGLQKLSSAYSDRVKDNNLKRGYGLSLVEWKQMLESQNGVCAVCRLPMTQVNVDHDHLTGKVRGLLCQPCNNGLGCFKDSVSSLSSAIHYLNHHAI